MGDTNNQKNKETTQTTQNTTQTTQTPLGSLRGDSAKIISYLKENPTTKYVTNQLKKNSSYVGKCLNRLRKRGYIERLDRGIWKVKKTSGVVTPSYPNEYYRLHSIEVKLAINSSHHSHIKSTIFNNMEFFNVRKTATGHYFDCIETLLLTKENLFIKYPKDFDITSDSKGELYEKTNNYIIETIKKIQSRFKVQIYRKNKINYVFVKQHLAHVKNSVAERIDADNIKVCVYDDDDGKQRIIMDRSKGLAELECVHPDKAFDDSDRIDYVMDNIKKGNLEDSLEYLKRNCDTGEDLPNSQIIYMIGEITKYHLKLTDEVRAIAKILMLTIPKPVELQPNNEPMDYVG